MTTRTTASFAPASGPAKRQRRSAVSLLDLPDGVLSQVFTSLTSTTHTYTFSGRAANRSRNALHLALCSRRLLRIFQSSLRHIHLDGAENPLFEDDAALSGILNLSSPILSSLSLKWFDRATLTPILSRLLLSPFLFPRLQSLTLHGLSASVSPCTLSATLVALAPSLQNLSLVAIPCLSLPGSDRADAPLLALAAAHPPLSSLELGGGAAVSHHALLTLWASVRGTLTSVDLHDLSHCSLGDSTLHALTIYAPKLRALNLTSFPGLTAQGLLAACTKLSRTLEELCVETGDMQSPCVSDSTTCAVVATCSKLSSVCFSRPPLHHDALSSSSVAATAFALGFRLRKISVYAAADFRDVDLCQLGESCPYIESLGLRACGEITGVGVASLAARLGENLRSVDLSGSVRVCDKALVALGEHCGRTLEFAWIAGLPLVTMAGVEKLLREAGRALRDVNVSRMDAVTPEEVARMVREYCTGTTLECVVIDGGGNAETTWEIERRRDEGRGVRCARLREEVERVRETCVNAVVVLEQDETVEEESGSEFGDEDWESASVFDAMEVEVG